MNIHELQLFVLHYGLSLKFILVKTCSKQKNTIFTKLIQKCILIFLNLAIKKFRCFVQNHIFSPNSYCCSKVLLLLPLPPFLWKCKCKWVSNPHTTTLWAEIHHRGGRKRWMRRRRRRRMREKKRKYMIPWMFNIFFSPLLLLFYWYANKRRIRQFSLLREMLLLLLLPQTFIRRRRRRRRRRGGGFDVKLSRKERDKITIWEAD